MSSRSRRAILTAVAAPVSHVQSHRLSTHVPGANSRLDNTRGQAAEAKVCFEALRCPRLPRAHHQDGSAALHDSSLSQVAPILRKDPFLMARQRRVVIPIV